MTRNQHLTLVELKLQLVSLCNTQNQYEFFSFLLGSDLFATISFLGPTPTHNFPSLTLNDLEEYMPNTLAHWTTTQQIDSAFLRWLMLSSCLSKSLEEFCCHHIPVDSEFINSDHASSSTKKRLWSHLVVSCFFLHASP